jgi:hypothetical protein
LFWFKLGGIGGRMPRSHRSSHASAPLRSLADALEELRKCNGLFGSGSIEIKVMMMALPDRHVTGLGVMLGPHQPDGTRSVIPLPSSASFRAAGTMGMRQCYDIEMLNDALCDAEGNVELSNGQYVHDIDFVPTPMHYDLTEDQREIVRYAIRFLDAENDCYRPIGPELLPGVIGLDYAKLPGIWIRSMKALHYELGKDLPDVEPHFISITLTRAGFRLPRAVQ